MENWWIYLVVIVGIIIVYLLTGLITYLLTKSARKKAMTLLDKVIPEERKRLDLILETRDTMLKDGRFLPKNMTDTTKQVEDEFAKIPVDVAHIKGMDDFLIVYYRKYLKEKRLLGKYGDLDKKLEAVTYLDPSDKKSPYYAYNKAALRYNSYLGMGFLNPFHGRSPQAPTL